MFQIFVFVAGAKDSVQVAHVLLEDDRDGWSIHGWSQHLDSILEAALNDADNGKAEAIAI